MGRPNKRNRFLDGQRLAVDVACPNVADALLSFEVVGCHLLHGYGCRLELSHLGGNGPVGHPLRIQQDEAYDREHNGNIYKNYEVPLVCCLHLEPFLCR